MSRANIDYIAYFNGEWMPLREVRIDPLDSGFTVGDVVFDLGRTFNGKSFRLKEHVDRLWRSLKFVRIDPGMSAEDMIELSEEALRRNEHLRGESEDLTVRQFVTRRDRRQAAPARAADRRGDRAARAVQRVRALLRDRSARIIVRTRSHPAQTIDPKLKHYSRLNFNLADLEAGDIDPDGYPILMDMDGYLTEGTGYNVFMVTDGVIRTPTDKAVLQGVSRGMVLELADQLGVEAIEEDLQPYDLYTADEAFFTGTSPCVLPVTKADHRQIGDGKPGPVVKQLLAAWGETVGVDIVGQALHGAKDGEVEVARQVGRAAALASSRGKFRSRRILAGIDYVSPPKGFMERRHSAS